MLCRVLIALSLCAALSAPARAEDPVRRSVLARAMETHDARVIDAVQVLLAQDFLPQLVSAVRDALPPIPGLSNAEIEEVTGRHLARLCESFARHAPYPQEGRVEVTGVTAVAVKWTAGQRTATVRLSIRIRNLAANELRSYNATVTVDTTTWALSAWTPRRTS